MLLRRTSLLSFISVLLFMSAQVAPAQPRNNRAAASPAQNAPEISYTVSMPEPHTHLLQVEMRVRAAGEGRLPAQLDLLMPVWTPGSYLVREYARHVQDFAAAEASGGGNNKSLAWRKINKNTWRVETGGAAREVRTSYSVYANELTVRTNELHDRHAFWNNGATLMYVDGQLGAPSTVRVVPFGDWKIATGLPAVPGQRNTFRAENFDVLYDSPFLVSDFKTLSFEVRGVPHRIVIDGEGNYDPERMRREVQKIVEASVELMGDVPYRDYTFMLMLHPSAGGGLEHLNSTALIWRRHAFRPEASWDDFLSLVAHEYFHLWNVKRIRPDALGPFDYTGENYTRLLWVAEGITSYYENIISRRAGIISDKDYLTTIANAIRGLQNTPGRLEQSIEEASFDAWIKYYRPDENTLNSAISYYDKGAIVGLLLDLEIRRRSAGAKSLDDVMRYLYIEHAKKNRNYTPEDFQRAAEQMAGASLEDFFRRYVRGREELDYNAAFAAVGLQLQTTAAAAAAATATPADASRPAAPTEAPKPAAQRAYFGANLRQDGDRLVVSSVPAGSPAYNQGITFGDQIVALDGLRVNSTTFNARLEEKKPGDEARVTVFRLDELRTFTIKLGGRAEENYRIVPLAQQTPEQRRLFDGWLYTMQQQQRAGGDK
ncbi:MAG TPA: PDZ domain-containing protein [Pyrinomonadaceae bacterium]|nr:PDZ domain-containing protein [Pyrinomonadaceae bacterium]